MFLFTQLWAKVGPDLLASSPCCRQPGMPLDGGYSRVAVDGSQRRRRDPCPHKMGKGEISVGPRGGVDFQSKLSFENGERRGGERRERCDARSVRLGWGQKRVGLRLKLGPSWSISLCVLLPPGSPEQDKTAHIYQRERSAGGQRVLDPPGSEIRHRASTSMGAGRAAFDLPQSHWFVRYVAAQMVRNWAGGWLVGAGWWRLVHICAQNLSGWQSASVN